MAAQDKNSDSRKAELVGNAFVEQYYVVLCKSPHNVHKFYQDSSVVSRPGLDGVITTVTTVQGINEKVLSIDNNKSSVEILTVEAQASYRDGFTVLVIGFLTREEYGRRKFVQSFFLAPQETGYYVLNDIFIFVDDELSVEANITPASVESAAAFTVAVPSELTKDVDQTVVNTTLISEDDANEKDKVCMPSANGDANATEKEVVNVPVEPNVSDVPVEPNVSNVPPIIVVAPLKPGTNDLPPFAVEASTSDVEKNTPKKSYASIVHKLKENTAPFDVKISRAKPLVKSHASAPVQAARAVTPTANYVPVRDSDNADKGYSIFVGRLPMSATQNQLKEAFARFGLIKPNGVQVRSNRPQELCFGFVEFESLSSMEEALKATNIMVGDRKVNIEEAKKNRVNHRGDNEKGRFPLGRGRFRSDNFRGRKNFGSRYNKNELGRRPEFSGHKHPNGEAQQNSEVCRKVEQNGVGSAASHVNA